MVLSDQNHPRCSFVTGGASGFGLNIAKALLEKGAQVAIGDINSGRLEEATRVLNNEHVLPVKLDVTVPSSVRDAIDICKKKFGGLDTLVNSAGVIHITPLNAITEEEWDHVIDVDLKGPFLTSQAAAPLLCDSGRGRIVNIGSDASRIGIPNIPHYCAAKAGVVGLTKSLAGELAPYKVTVNCVCPVGVSGTNMGQEVLRWKVDETGKTDQEVLDSTAADIPLKRNATTADIVNAVMFFIAEESNFLTGNAIDVDGGMLNTVPITGVS